MAKGEPSLLAPAGCGAGGEYTYRMQLSSKVAICALVGATLMLPRVVCADPLLIEPDNYAVGTDLSHAFPGITLSTFSNQNPAGLFEYLAVTVRRDANCVAFPTECTAFSGAHLLSGPGTVNDYRGLGAMAECFANEAIRSGSVACVDPENGRPGGVYNTDAPLLVSLAQPTDLVEISGTVGFEPIGLFAFDADFNLLGGLGGGAFVYESYDEDGNPLEWRRSLTTFRTEARQISYVLAASRNGVGFIDTIRIGERGNVAAVPEPGTAGLIALGLGACGLVRRRRRGTALAATDTAVESD
jgi:hypothetical protein